MRLLISLALAVLSVVAPLPARAATSDLVITYFTANEFLQWCDGPTRNKSLAQGFVAGVSDGFHVLRTVYPNEVPLCLPNNIPLGQLTDIVCVHIQNNPKERHYSASINAFKALIDAFPCKK